MASDALVQSVSQVIHENEVVVYSKTYCPYCDRAKELLKSLNVTPHIIELDTAPNGTQLQAALAQYLHKDRVTVPQVFVQRGAHHLGGCTDIEALHRAGKLVPYLQGGSA